MPPTSIVVIDDHPVNFDVVDMLLGGDTPAWNAGHPCELHYAESGFEALQQLPDWQPDLILLDIMMPEMDGIEVCKLLKATPQWQGVPIIVVTALTEKQDLARCLAAGADDFVSKPLNVLELTARVQSMLRIRRQQQRLATFNRELEATVQQRTAALERLVLQDGLTQLPSQRAFLAALAHQLEANKTAIALVYLDCDQFQLVNGSLGNEVGDQLLRAIAARLQQHQRPTDLLTRCGGDEFCFALSQIHQFPDLAPWLDRLHQSFDQPFTVNGLEIFMSVSMGVALGQGNQRCPKLLMQDAEMAMYRAKSRGQRQVQVFDQQMRVDISHRLTLENDLQRALDRQEFFTVYQPIVDLKTQGTVGFEALLRWQHPDRGIVSPDQFIPCLETTGLIGPVGLVVLRQACEQLQRWHQQGYPHLTVSVNLSTRQFASPSLVQDIDQVLATTGIDPARLKLEITESAIMDSAESAIALLAALRSRQIQICIDDFGTGYSSLGYLHRFPLDILKIDRSFINQSDTSNVSYQVVDIIMALAQRMQLTVVAEGVETQDQLQTLQQLGCELGQGYYFGKPLPAAELGSRL